jgi:hypothetical protein
MSLKSLAARAGIAVITLTALGLVAAAPASAHTNNMYTVIEFDETTEALGFATYSKTDGTTAYLGEMFPADQTLDIAGIEVHEEQGLVIGDNDGSTFVQAWDHTTGEVVPAAPSLSLGLEDTTLDGVVGLDTLLDGTPVTIVEFESTSDPEDPTDRVALASVNPATGELIILVDFSGAIALDDGTLVYDPTGVATDPATGITYVFLESDDDEVFFLPITAAPVTIGVPTLFEGSYFERGRIDGADFDPTDGSLYFNYENYPNQSLELLKLGAPSTWPTANPFYISTAPAEFGATFIFPQALTIEYTALAATGSELPILAIVLVGSVAVVAGGVTVMVARRRSETGTV